MGPVFLNVTLNYFYLLFVLLLWYKFEFFWESNQWRRFTSYKKGMYKIFKMWPVLYCIMHTSLKLVWLLYWILHLQNVQSWKLESKIFFYFMIKGKDQYQIRTRKFHWSHTLTIFCFGDLYHLLIWTNLIRECFFRPRNNKFL